MAAPPDQPADRRYQHRMRTELLISGNPTIPNLVPYVSSLVRAARNNRRNDRQYRVIIQSNIAVGDAIAMPSKLRIRRRNICDVDDPGRTESACAGPTHRIRCPACGGLSNQTKILGHNVNSEDVWGATPSPAEPTAPPPPTAAAAMSHNRPPMSTILPIALGDNPNPIRRMAGHGQSASILPHSPSARPRKAGTGIARPSGSARYHGLCRAAVKCPALEGVETLRSKV